MRVHVDSAREYILARSIVEAHGGSISAESELGKGTKIRLVFPG